jgi:hypothetical protein
MITGKKKKKKTDRFMEQKKDMIHYLPNLTTTTISCGKAMTV